MKLYKLIPSNEHKSYVVKDISLNFVNEFMNAGSLVSNWTLKDISNSGAGIDSYINFCSYPKAIIISEEIKPIFENELKNEKVEYLPVTDGKKNYYVVHCYECADVKNRVEKQFLKRSYYVDIKSFKEKYDEELYVFKLLGRGVVDVILAELYTEKMVSFINSLDNPGITFEEVGEIRNISE